MKAIRRICSPCAIPMRAPARASSGGGIAKVLWGVAGAVPRAGMPVFAVPAADDGRVHVDSLRSRCRARARPLEKFARWRANTACRSNARRVGTILRTKHRATRCTQDRADLYRGRVPPRSPARPWLIQLTDWELLRASDLPVHAAQECARSYGVPLVLAAVDPTHAHCQPRAWTPTSCSAAPSSAAPARQAARHCSRHNPPLTRSGWAIRPSMARDRDDYDELELEGREAFGDSWTRWTSSLRGGTW
jgi:hypothetical protein